MNSQLQTGQRGWLRCRFDTDRLMAAVNCQGRLAVGAGLYGVGLALIGMSAPDANMPLLVLGASNTILGFSLAERSIDPV